MARALYRKYRSRSLDEIVGQSHITDVLKKSLEQGRVGHAYLLTGPRGVGKTSIARILAHEINGLPYDEETNHLDIIEIDAASNNGVDDVRELREKVQVAPVSAKKKIYIIDEVHMLSKAAFNALLKTLEEPPEHIVFIFATTDIEKLPATIISRVQRYAFRSISRDDLVSHLRFIANQEAINIEDNALELIAQHGNGSFRDSISLLDQLCSFSSTDKAIGLADIETSLGLAPETMIDSLIKAYEAHDLKSIVSLLDQAEASNIQGGALAHQLQQYIRAHVLASPQLIPLLDALLGVSSSPQPQLKLLTVLATPHTLASKPQKNASLAASAPPSIALESPAKKEVKAPVVKDSPTPISLPAHSPVGTDIDWQALIDQAKPRSIALYSLLKKCSPRQSGTSLTIYTGNGFTKKRLDDLKQRQFLTESLVAIGHADIDIETIASTPPLADSRAAAVAAIMGGGEEVHVS